MPRVPKRSREDWTQDVWDRREKIASLMHLRLSLSKMSALCGVAKTTIRMDLRALRAGKERPPPDRTGASATAYVKDLKSRVAKMLAWNKLRWPAGKSAGVLSSQEIVSLRDILREEGYQLQAVVDLFNEWGVPTRTGVPWSEGTVRCICRERCARRKDRKRVIRELSDVIRGHLLDDPAFTWANLAEHLNEKSTFDHRGRPWTRCSLINFCSYYGVRRAIPYGGVANSRLVRSNAPISGAEFARFLRIETQKHARTHITAEPATNRVQ